mmetsp:Transcript_6580/g.16898  ORF Transcript_6580/g.16898 Transcript_6580/m.16898 type:complete len:210 (+) Transcript_6580:935-1564(+)
MLVTAALKLTALTSSPVRMSQTRMDLSSPPEIHTCSVRSKMAFLMAPVCPFITTTASSPFSTSQHRTTLSLQPVRRRWASPEKSTALTMCGCAYVRNSSPVSAFQVLAEKSAAPVAQRRAALSMVAPHTAPLCPSNVPIQSPVIPFRRMGLPSLHALIRKKPSSVTGLKARSTTGRVCPEHVSGVCLGNAAAGAAIATVAPRHPHVPSR